MTAPAIILSRAQLGENIGAAARAMANFGLSDLRLVTPVCRWPNDKATAMAVGASNITDSARVFDTLDAALGDLQFVYAATARERGMAKQILTPAEAAKRLREAAARGERTGFCSVMNAPASTMTRFRLPAPSSRSRPIRHFHRSISRRPSC